MTVLDNNYYSKSNVELKTATILVESFLIKISFCSVIEFKNKHS